MSRRTILKELFVLFIVGRIGYTVSKKPKPIYVDISIKGTFSLYSSLKKLTYWKGGY